MQIKEANQELLQCTEVNRTLEQSRLKRKTIRHDIDFKLIRHHARSLYKVMITGRSWKCRCRKSHVANLRLEPRPWGSMGSNSKRSKAAGFPSTLPPLNFRVLLSKQYPRNSQATTCKWQEFDVEPVRSPGTSPSQDPNDHLGTMTSPYVCRLLLT